MAAFLMYPRLRAHFSTLARVLAEILGLPRSARLTVFFDTPAAQAIWAMEGRRFIRVLLSYKSIMGKLDWTP